MRERAEPVVDKYSADDLQNAGRLKQMRMVAGLVHQRNKKALPLTFGSALAIIVIVVLVAVFTGMWYLVPFGVLLGALAAMILFGRFAQRAQYSAIEGQAGAAAAVLQNMRGGWTVTPAVSANRNLDVVHRAVGKPGVVLVGEGVPSRLNGLIAAEKKRTARVAHDVPIFEFQVGNAEGQIPVSQLQKKIMRLPRNLKTPAVSDLNYRLKALQPNLQMPKGPMPKGARMPRMPRPRLQEGPPDPPRLLSRLRLHSDDDRVGGAVVEAAQVAVGYARRDHAEQQERAYQCPHEAGTAAARPDHADAQEALADREAADRGEQVDLQEAEQQRPVLRRGIRRVRWADQ
jgi:hypothetical protein